jgi:AICAR transformylase/IMP cyclohydrolase PurH
MTRLAAVFPAESHSFALAAKHVDVCGAGIVQDKGNAAIIEAVRSMIEGDEVAIHGGVLLLNFHITVEIADMLLHYHVPDGQRRILDAIFAPSADQEAIDTLSRKKGKCRVMLNPALAGDLPMDETMPFTHVGGGDYTYYPPSQFVLSFDDPDLQIIGPRRPELEGCLKAGWAIGSQAKSNTITIVRMRQVGEMVVYELEGNGCGRMDRVGAADLAVQIYQRSESSRPPEQRVGLQFAAAYSDSFLPFADAGQMLRQAGITVLFASSGSVNDQQVQDELAAAGMTLYLIPDKKCRGFRH